MNKCPHCGAQELIGVWFPPVKAQILHAIQRRGTEGISAHELGHMSNVIEASRKKLPLSRANIKMHVVIINEMLEETDYKVRALRTGFRESVWRLIRRGGSSAAANPNRQSTAGRLGRILAGT